MAKPKTKKPTLKERVKQLESENRRLRAEVDDYRDREIRQAIREAAGDNSPI